ncbi:hypothetical protein N7493_005280 [Penicillium malachiteum]|uniref:Uncharacterized protein n=1 Tax=Penicillium malachiteum TaxID=1324776 RepID=A0AAD6HMW8_9EURO|nr:hypothetical protein N7493_005280 [Penicillium malachiteum]
MGSTGTPKPSRSRFEPVGHVRSSVMNDLASVEIVPVYGLFARDMTIHQNHKLRISQSTV